MAIVGLTSPFKKSSKGSSPLKFNWLQTAVAGLNYIGSRKEKKRARRREAEAREELERGREAYMAMEFSNPYEGLENPYADMTNQYSGLENQFAGMQNQYAGLENQYAGLQNQFAGLSNQFQGMENVYEEAQVDTRAADYMREQTQQQLATTLGGLSGTAGSSGVAGLAQSLANVGVQQARQASIDIGRQERQSEMARRGESSRIQQLQRGEESRLQQLSAGERARLQGMTAGEASRLQQLSAGEKARLQGLTAGEQARLQGLTAAEAGRLDQLGRSGEFQTDMLRRQGEFSVEQREQQRIMDMYGLGADTAVATSQASQLAGQNQASAFGNLATAVGGLYSSGAFSGSSQTPMIANAQNTQGIFPGDANPLPGLGADPTPWNTFDN